MFVGYMRNYKNPPYMAKLISMLCHYHGINLIYLRPRDVNMEKNTVKGKVFLNNKWEVIETDLPPLIDISPYCFNRVKVMDYLQMNTTLTDSHQNRLGKNELQKALVQDAEYSHLVIPTRNVKEIKDIEKSLKEFSTLVLKPIDGQRGKGIFLVEKKGRNYVVGHNKEEQVLSNHEFTKLFNEEMKDNNYIAQKFITSRALSGDPFDCRIHVQKNKQGKWVIAKKFIRIGIGQKVISNVNQGGGISQTKPFLKANYGDKWEEIEQRLVNLGRTLPYKIEEIRETKLITIGFDIGIDKDGKLYIFEANSAPTMSPLKAEAAMLRADYYKYVLTNKSQSK